MKVKVSSSELSRMMKTVVQCIDQRDLTNKANIEIRHENNMLSIRSTNGTMSADMSTPLLGGDGEAFCVDGQMFARVVGACSGDVDITTDGTSCYVKCAGRTRLPVVNAKLPGHEVISGKHTVIKASDFIRAFNGVAYAMSSDQTTRPILTGVLLEVQHAALRMVALDGFQMSVDYAKCDGDKLSAVVPGAFMKMVAQSVSADSDISVSISENRIATSTEDMTLTSVLMSGQYPAYQNLLPQNMKTKCLVKCSDLLNALKSGSVVNSKQNLVRLEIGDDNIRILNNGESASYDADVPCKSEGIEGSVFKIAFNQKYLMNTINAISSEDCTMEFGTSTAPCVVNEVFAEDCYGVRLLLPVRVQG